MTPSRFSGLTEVDDNGELVTQQEREERKKNEENLEEHEGNMEVKKDIKKRT